MFRIKFCRETILKLLYQADTLKYQATDIEKIWHDDTFFLKGLNQTERDFVMKVVNKITEEKENIDEMISEKLIGWKLNRLGIIDRNLLRMGIGESFFNDQKAIIIDDMVRIAKKYGDKDTYKVVNAILDRVIQ